MNAVEIGPVPASQRTQSPLDLFLIFVGADIVATTLVSGATLTPAFGAREALAVIAIGSVLGAALVAVLSPIGPRLGVPSVIAARAALGMRGAAGLAIILYVTNFAWIALNNLIAASAMAQVFGGPASEKAWAIALGLLATVVVTAGPRAVGLADRVAVPLMVLTGLALTVRCLGLPKETLAAPGAGGMSWFQGLDIVVGYQVSWILMFADYSRYTAAATRGAVAVFLGLALPSLWFMGLGFLAALLSGSADPGTMITRAGLGASGAIMLALATLTTNFVNIYLSALAWKSLLPGTSDRASVWSIGLIGTALGLVSRSWLDQYAQFMLLLGALLVPVGGVLFAHFFVLRSHTDVPALYEPRGRYAYIGGFSGAGVAAWAVGAVVYFAANRWGGTLPSVATAVALYTVLGPRGSSSS